MEELTDFRRQAKTILQRGHLKCTKETSLFDGVSPDTAKTRPPYKKHFSRRQLDFDQSEYSNYYLQITQMHTAKFAIVSIAPLQSQSTAPDVQGSSLLSSRSTSSLPHC